MISKRYTDYKRVSSYHYVDEIPSDWKLLPNIALFNERVIKNNLNKELLSVTINKGIIKQKDVQIKKDSSNEDKSNYKLVMINDIAYNKMRMWQGAVGYSKFQGIVSPAYIVLKPKKNVNSVFFHYLLRTNYYNNYVRRFSYGLCDDQLNLRYKDFKRMYSIVPPLETQTKIAEYLDRKQKQANNFIAKQKKMIELLKEQKKAIINQAVTKGINPNVKMKDSGVEWLGEIPEHWEVRKLKYVLTIRNGDGIPSEKIVNDSDFQVYGGNGFLGYYSNYNVSDFTLVIGRVGAKCGNVHLVNDNIWVNDNAMLVKTKQNYDYLYYILLSADLNKLSFANAQPLITGTNVKNLKVIFTSNEDEQTKIVKFINLKLSIIDSAISKAEEEIKLVKEYLESLIFNVVTGQICVE